MSILEAMGFSALVILSIAAVMGALMWWIRWCAWHIESRTASCAAAFAPLVVAAWALLTMALVSAS